MRGATLQSLRWVAFGKKIAFHTILVDILLQLHLYQWRSEGGQLLPGAGYKEKFKKF